MLNRIATEAKSCGAIAAPGFMDLHVDLEMVEMVLHVDHQGLTCRP
jgi:hypothetical protein